ncbi:hypothetical protein DFH08DRAFT_823763 [Mycena albidolilacea]|uniref:Uncharacterized protein n=1 Tax=Mycena albidolilacea TaxID=1033008 RepID=A0AAD6Z617_9AGAR|nr:hypothetical protein DFH08DRAFT_823763 [Mycena albidolilacea]
MTTHSERIYTFGWEFFKINSPISAKSLAQMRGREARKNFRKLVTSPPVVPPLTMRFATNGPYGNTARAEHRKRQDAEELQRARNVKLARRLRHDMEEAECIRKAEAVQAQRDKWKAASAHYYLKHPEIKEKKRTKMAEKRAARKLAQRRWDPPKAAWQAVRSVCASVQLIVGRKPDGEGQLGDFSGTPDLDLDWKMGDREALGDFLGISKDGHNTADTVATTSLLFLRTHRPPQQQPSGASGDAWSGLAPDYPSSDE